MFFRLFIILAVLGVTGWLHGKWTDRWGTSSDVETAAAALPSVPLVFGDWEGRDLTREDSEVVIRSASPQIIRRYVNRTTGAAVGLLITCGRPSGMVIEHNPKTCYTELGFEEVGAGQKVSSGSLDAHDELFAHTFVKSAPTATTRVRVFWTWGQGQTWSFPERPRVAFAKYPVLYKLYVTRDLLSENEPLTGDPALQFLQVALPDITKALATRPQ